MARTNHAGVTEKAEFNIDLEKFGEGHERVFGSGPKKWCDDCEKRLTMCECEDKDVSKRQE